MPTNATFFQNTPNNSDFARVAEFDGTVPADVIRSPGSEVKPLADGSGRLIINAIPFSPGFDELAQVTAGMAAPFSNLLIVSTPGPVELVAISGFNADTVSDLYVQLFDVTAMPPGVATPALIIPVPKTQPFSYSLPLRTLFGLGVAMSSTPYVYTAAVQLASMVCIYRIPSF